MVVYVRYFTLSRDCESVKGALVLLFSPDQLH